MAASMPSNRPPPAATAPDAQQVGLRIRATRRRRKLTLAQVSAQTGLDKGFLSRLERGEKFASVGTLHTVATALDTTLSALLGETDPKDEIHIVRAGERHRLASSDRDPGEHAYEAITMGGTGSGLSVMVVQVGSHGERTVANHAGDELIFVLEGRVRVYFGEHTVLLERDDSVRFPGYLPHSLRAEGRKTARALIVIASDRN
ncbi:XRE family transcriptional regulator [Bordetella genomosp. 2]|uniref:XRE family transcriptional regulator n=2 Tax=Bordetella TaxID=517 RepID=A0A261VTD4_9BORD|nr:XRE family transcriptional regulator [Bordetella genomosp. 2]